MHEQHIRNPTKWWSQQHPLVAPEVDHFVFYTVKTSPSTTFCPQPVLLAQV
jgi:hypothetical protein